MELPALSQPAFLASKGHRRVYERTLLVYSALGLMLSFVPALQALPHVTADRHVETIRWAVQVAAVFLLLAFLCIRVVESLHEHHLETLERRILMEDLTGTDIKALYAREFLGPTVRDWLIEAEQDLARLRDSFITSAKEGERRFRELGVVDKTMTYEILGRTRDICSDVKMGFDRYSNYSKELVSKLRYLNQEMALVATPDLVEQILSSWDTQLEDIRRRYEDVCRVCRETTETTPQGVLRTEGEMAPNCSRRTSALASDE